MGDQQAQVTNDNTSKQVDNRSSGNMQRALSGLPDKYLSENAERAKISPMNSFAIQTKLRVGPTNDKYEQEADRVAEQAVHMAYPIVQQLGLDRIYTGEKRGLPPITPQQETKQKEITSQEALVTKHIGILHRHAAGAGPAIAPDIVYEVLQSPGQIIPANVREDMEAQLGQQFEDVRVHTSERAGASAEAVAANAYTVGRQIVFAPGRFEPGTMQGRLLLAHELTHAASYPRGVPKPSGDLRISSPTDASERHATTVSERVLDSTHSPGTPETATENANHITHSNVIPTPSTQPCLFRQTTPPVELSGVNLNHRRVTVPPAAGLVFSATASPSNAAGVTFSINGLNASIAAGTTVDAAGNITVDASQTGGSAEVRASQTSTGKWATVPFNFTAIPTGITSTSAVPSNQTGRYGGDFTHTFTAPGGNQTELDRSHVNELFAGTSGTTLNLSGPLARLSITVNNANSATAGWDLNSSGTMAGPDHVTWGNSIDARPFVTNASNPTPANVLPQEITATQSFRNLEFPARTYGAATVASTTHRRAFEDRSNQLVAVSSANASGIHQEIVESYVGPTVFHRIAATEKAIRMSLPTPPGGSPVTPDTTTISVATEGRAATPRFSVRAPAHGCSITQAGVLTPGMSVGTSDLTVTVRAGSAANYDEIPVTLTPQPATFIRLTADSSVTQIIADNQLADRNIDAATLLRLNPEFASSTTIPAGSVIWLKARDVPAGQAASLEDIATRYFGNRFRWPTVWSFNSHITDPGAIAPATRIHLQSEADRAAFGEEVLIQ